MSSVTLAEIRFGIERLPEGPRRADLADWLNPRVRPTFERRILSVSEDAMLRRRWLVDDGRRTGRTFAQPDLPITAAALLHGLALVTRNTGDFVHARVPVHNPWLDPLPT